MKYTISSCVLVSWDYMPLPCITSIYIHYLNFKKITPDSKKKIVNEPEKEKVQF